jgi:uncharacterized protein (DUF1800 family)
MTEAMVDRLFWRAGFGPSAAHRAAWTGMKVGALVDFLVNTPGEAAPVVDGHPTADLLGIYSAYYATLPRPPKDSGGEIIDPNASDTELELEWIDRMQRATNPLPDRLAFFWHRHWAISRDDGIANHLILQYRNRLLRYADLGANPNASFRDLAFEMTTKDAAMSLYLNINQNVKSKPNENYARELMELFCLGPNAPDGQPNYSQKDVAELARALTGWTFNNTSTAAAYGSTTFTASRFDATAKVLFSPDDSGAANPFSAPRTIAAVSPVNRTTAEASVADAVRFVLEHANHAQFLIRKLWAEFIASPIPQATLDALVAAYRVDYKLKPLIRAILAHPLLMESIDEPNLIKPPIVYIIGALRQFDAPLKHNEIETSMNAMQQKVYFPPNVSGWEGGLAWLNTNTVQGRFDLIAKLQKLKYSNFYDAATHYLDPSAATPELWFTLAHESLNRPWVSAATKQAIVTYATDNPLVANPSVAVRRQRLYVLQAMILGGPDGQVM